jgi:hypothetical protein
MLSFEQNNHTRTNRSHLPLFGGLKPLFIGIFILNCVSLLVIAFATLSPNAPSPQAYREMTTIMNAFTPATDASDKPDQLDPPAKPDQPDQLVKSDESEYDPYTFQEPILAYHLLKKLDEFKPIDGKKYYNQLASSGNWSHIPYLGLNIDDQYCDKHRLAFVHDPTFVFQESNAIYDLYPKHYVRYIALAGILTDFQPNISLKIPEADKNKRLSWIDPKQNFIYMNNYLHCMQHLNKNMGCLTQTYNHIPGAGYLNRKDLVSEAMNQYAEQYKDRPQCFSFEKSFPRTWVMYIKEQCEDFFKHLHSEEHDQLKAVNNIVYIRKIGAGSHNGQGVFSMDDQEEQDVIKLYENGTKCGKVPKDTNVIQYFIPNPLLVYGHKFDFRVYMLVASINPLIAYYYDGYLKVSLHKYEPHSSDKYALLTNTHVSTEVLKEATNGTLVNGMNETELQYFQRWNFTRFQNYLLEEGIVTDPEWLDNHLRPEFKRAMIHLLRMTRDKLLVQSQLHELFGVDFMLDQNLDLWFIEVNSSPSLSPTHPESEIFIRKHMIDLFEIIKGVTRSRAKRIVQFINKLTKERGFGMDANGDIIMKDFEQKKAEFEKVIENRLEEEYQPSPKNDYRLLIDEHLEGVDRYNGFITAECL